MNRPVFFYMITDTLAKLSTATLLTVGQLLTPLAPAENILSSHEMSLEKRYYPVQKENILLNMAYLRGKEGPLHMDGRVSKKEDINWDEIKKPFKSEFRLEPGQVFAYHDDILPQFEGKNIKTQSSHFMANEGYVSAGYLVGDGVCHSASLIYWAALDAGLEALAPTDHDFMAIPEIESKYGVSIYANPESKGSNTKQNLYITNNKEHPVEFKFDYNGDKLKISIVEVN
ncbi:MAG: VanW family protein [Patescibacteria group bacterium]